MAAARVRAFTPRLLHDLHSEQQLGERLFKMRRNITESDDLNCVENWREGALAMTPEPGAKPDFSKSCGGWPAGGLSDPRPARASCLVGDSKSAGWAVCSGASWLLTCFASTEETSEGKGSWEQTPEAPPSPPPRGRGSAGGGLGAREPPAGRTCESAEAPVGLALPGQGVWHVPEPGSFQSLPHAAPVLGASRFLGSSGGAEAGLTEPGAGCEGHGLAHLCLLPQGHRWLLGEVTCDRAGPWDPRVLPLCPKPRASGMIREVLGGGRKKTLISKTIRSQIKSRFINPHNPPDSLNNILAGKSGFWEVDRTDALLFWRPLLSRTISFLSVSFSMLSVGFRKSSSVLCVRAGCSINTSRQTGRYRGAAVSTWAQEPRGPGPRALPSRDMILGKRATGRAAGLVQVRLPQSYRQRPRKRVSVSLHIIDMVPPSIGII